MFASLREDSCSSPFIGFKILIRNNFQRIEFFNFNILPYCLRDGVIYKLKKNHNTSIIEIVLFFTFREWFDREKLIKTKRVNGGIKTKGTPKGASNWDLDNDIDSDKWASFG